VVVQLVRMPACHAGGRGFESRPFRKRALEKSKALFVFGVFLIDVRYLKERFFCYFNFWLQDVSFF